MFNPGTSLYERTGNIEAGIKLCFADSLEMAVNMS
jgi:hypothetical protein